MDAKNLLIAAAVAGVLYYVATHTCIGRSLVARVTGKAEPCCGDCAKGTLQPASPASPEVVVDAAVGGMKPTPVGGLDFGGTKPVSANNLDLRELASHPTGAVAIGGNLDPCGNGPCMPLPYSYQPRSAL